MYTSDLLISKMNDLFHLVSHLADLISNMGAFNIQDGIVSSPFNSFHLSVSYMKFIVA